MLDQEQYRHGVFVAHVEQRRDGSLLEQQNAKPKDFVEIGVDAEDYYKIKDSEKSE